MIVKVSGKVDGRNVIFDRAEGDQWKVRVPFDLDGMYVIKVTAEDDSGNIAYCTKMLLIVDPATLCVKLIPAEYTVKVITEDHKLMVIQEEYTVETIPDQYQVTAEQDPFLVEVIYPVHGRRCCCE